MLAKSSEHCGSRRDCRARKRQVLNVYRIPPQRGSRRYSISSLSGRSPPLRERGGKRRPLKVYSPRGAGISTSNIVVTFESSEPNVDDTTFMDSAPFCRARMNQVHRTSGFSQMTSLAKSVRSRKKTFVNKSTRH